MVEPSSLDQYFATLALERQVQVLDCQQQLHQHQHQQQQCSQDQPQQTQRQQAQHNLYNTSDLNECIRSPSLMMGAPRRLQIPPGTPKAPSLCANGQSPSSIILIADPAASPATQRGSRKRVRLSPKQPRPSRRRSDTFPLKKSTFDRWDTSIAGRNSAAPTTSRRHRTSVCDMMLNTGPPRTNDQVPVPTVRRRSIDSEEGSRGQSRLDGPDDSLPVVTHDISRLKHVHDVLDGATKIINSNPAVAVSVEIMDGSAVVRGALDPRADCDKPPCMPVKQRNESICGGKRGAMPSLSPSSSQSVAVPQAFRSPPTALRNLPYYE